MIISRSYLVKIKGEVGKLTFPMEDKNITKEIDIMLANILATKYIKESNNENS